MTLDVRMVAICDNCHAEVPVRLYLDNGGFGNIPFPEWQEDDGSNIDGWRLPSSTRTPDKIRCPECAAEGAP